MYEILNWTGIFSTNFQYFGNIDGIFQIIIMQCNYFLWYGYCIPKFFNVYCKRYNFSAQYPCDTAKLYYVNYFFSLNKSILFLSMYAQHSHNVKIWNHRFQLLPPFLEFYDMFIENNKCNLITKGKMSYFYCK